MRVQTSLEVKELLDVASHWAHEDDWSVPSIYIEALEEIALALAAGDDPVYLARHAKHTNNVCRRYGCADRIPYTIEKDRALMARIENGG